MRDASPALKTFLISTQNMVRADLYTITLSGGAVLRWTGADVPVVANGLTYQPIAGIRDDGVKSRRGVRVDNLNVTIQADERHQINGVPVIEFILRNGLDGANFKVERAFATDWTEMDSSGPVGTIVRFAGRFSEIMEGGSSEVTVVVTSWMELLNSNVPSDVYQASCLNTVFNTKCGVVRTDFDAAGTVSAGTHTTTTLATNLAATAGYYNSGTIIFTSGVNNGLRRTVRTQDASGNLVLVSPLPAAPSAGDTFTAYPGCDLKQSTCSSKFNNLLRFRGQPYIPIPETAL